ncbi:MAG: tetratricopeptide repeat protein [Rhodothermales bacterium]|nr:tetratricopeptide repeat protein [Rhodothermales bacterium]
MSRIPILLGYLEADPDDAFTRFALALEYIKESDHTRALELFEGLVNDQPEYVGTYYHLAGLYRELNRGDEARATYEAGIAVASRLGDRHAESELRGALLELEIEG